MGFMDESIEAKQAKAQEYAELQKTVSQLIREVKALRGEIDGLHESIEKVTYDTHTDISKQITENADKALARLRNEAASIADLLAENRKKEKKMQLSEWAENALIVLAFIAIFSIPCLFAGWFFKTDTTDRILWNQNYPQQTVSPFTSEEEFEKLKENQKTYLENEKKKAAQAQQTQKQ